MMLSSFLAAVFLVVPASGVHSQVGDVQDASYEAVVVDDESRDGDEEAPDKKQEDENDDENDDKNDDNDGDEDDDDEYDDSELISENAYTGNTTGPQYAKTAGETKSRAKTLRDVIANVSGVDKSVLDDLDETDTLEETNVKNCMEAQGAWMGPTVHTKKQKDIVAKWKALKSQGESKGGKSVKLGFVMMLYETVVFKKAWKQLLSQKGVPYGMVIHAKKGPKKVPKFFKKFITKQDFSNDRCKDAHLMLGLMGVLLKKDKQVSHVAIVSGDTLPIKPLSHMRLDVQSDSRTRFCADPVWKRAETFFVMRRDHAGFLLQNEKLLQKLVPTVDAHPDTRCLDEDQFYWPLRVHIEDLANSCAMMTDWSGTNKYWKKNAERCDCPRFLSSGKDAPNCAHPAVFKSITSGGLNELVSSNAGFWFARKFPGDGVPGAVSYNKGKPKFDDTVARVLLSMEMIRAMPLAVEYNAE